MHRAGNSKGHHGHYIDWIRQLVEEVVGVCRPGGGGREGGRFCKCSWEVVGGTQVSIVLYTPQSLGRVCRHQVGS